MSELIVNLPVAVPVTKGGKMFAINMNQYRNAHFRTLDKAKKVFKEMVREQILALPYLGQIAVTYTFYPGKGIIADTNNVCAIADKFFLDALVELSRIKNDTRAFVLGTQMLPGPRDLLNPRVEARITIHR